MIRYLLRIFLSAFPRPKPDSRPPYIRRQHDEAYWDLVLRQTHRAWCPAGKGDA